MREPRSLARSAPAYSPTPYGPGSSLPGMPVSALVRAGTGVGVLATISAYAPPVMGLWRAVRSDGVALGSTPMSMPKARHIEYRLGA